MNSLKIYIFIYLKYIKYINNIKIYEIYIFIIFLQLFVNIIKYISNNIEIYYYLLHVIQ